VIFDKNSLEQMQRISHRDWRKKTEQPQINADKDKTAKGQEWTRIKIEREPSSAWAFTGIRVHSRFAFFLRAWNTIREKIRPVGVRRDYCHADDVALLRADRFGLNQRFPQALQQLHDPASFVGAHRKHLFRNPPANTNMRHARLN
jgi:hypothetical protein